MLQEPTFVEGIRWRRVGTTGRDACALLHGRTGWLLRGTAVFHPPEGVARLTYGITCDHRWATLRGHVVGRWGDRALGVEVARTAGGGWSLNGAEVAGLEGCVDLDLGFTPATNLVAIRRLALQPGEAAQAPAAWLDLPAGTLTRLDQRYERRSSTTYGYAAPRFGYEALLAVAPSGFVRDYPGLWEAEG